MAGGAGTVTPPPRMPASPKTPPPGVKGPGDQNVQQGLIDSINAPSSPEGGDNAQATEKKAGGEGSSAGLIAAAVLVVATPFLIIFGAVFGVLRSTANSSGATIPQPINVAAPSSEVTHLLSVFNAASNTTSFLNDNGALLDTYSTNLTLLQTKIQAGDPAYTSIPNKDAVLALIPTMLTQIQTLKADISAGQKEKLTADAKAFQANIRKLTQLFAPNIATIALQYANENAASGYTKYNYVYGDTQLLEDLKSKRTIRTPSLNDCSGFISAIIYQAGIGIGTHYTTNSLYETAKAGTLGFSLVATSSSNSGIDDDTVMKNIQPGDILITADVQFPGAVSGEGGNGNHASIFVGNDTVVENTKLKTGPNGVQTETLEHRLDHHGPNHVQAIVRPPAGGAS